MNDLWFEDEISVDVFNPYIACLTCGEPALPSELSDDDECPGCVKAAAVFDLIFDGLAVEEDVTCPDELIEQFLDDHNTNVV